MHKRKNNLNFIYNKKGSELTVSTQEKDHGAAMYEVLMMIGSETENKTENILMPL